MAARSWRAASAARSRSSTSEGASVCPPGSAPSASCAPGSSAGAGVSGLAMRGKALARANGAGKRPSHSATAARRTLVRPSPTLLAAASAFLLTVPVAADPEAVSAVTSAEASPGAGRPLVVYVVVPLCSNAQIDCGSSIAGRPTDLAHNIYWGAIFGARRFLERKGSGWERVDVAAEDGARLERAVFRMRVPGTPWGR